MIFYKWSTNYSVSTLTVPDGRLLSLYFNKIN